ncbi:MAG: cell division protein FtsA [Alistipes sp.]|jgi:cell division protein FtsA|nr:cell division protein FtsA [Alistipes sp.]
MDKKNCIAAMDMGTGSVTIAVGRAGEDGRLELVDVTSKPMRGITRGEITNRQQVSESVKEVVAEVEQKLGLSLSDLYTGTSGRHVRCAGHDYYVFVGERSDGEIRQEDMDALREGMNNVQAEDGLRIMDRIPQKYVVDGRDTVKDPVGRFGKKLETTFNFVLGSATLLDRLEKTLMALGVRSRKTYPNAIASAEAVTLPEEREMGVAVVDLGAGTTDLCVWHDNAVRFVRGIPFGSGDIDSDIHQQGILEKHVDGLKTTFGVAMADLVTADKLIAIAGRSPREKQEISQRNLATIIEHRLREIIGFVVDEIGDSGYSGRLRGGIVLTGGGSRLVGIDALFREVTGLEVRLALPDVCVADESLPMAQDPSHATAIGLLLKAIAEVAPARVVINGPAGGGTGASTGAGAGIGNSGASGSGGNSDDEDDDDKPRERKKKEKRGGLKRWFEGFLSEPLDGDEDF